MVNYLKVFCINLFLWMTPVVNAQQEYKAVVLFEKDQFVLTSEAKQKLQQLYSNSLISASDIRLVGHTDSDGANDYNLILSQKRVKTVSDYLVNLGIDEGALSTYYKGEDQALNQNKNQWQKQENRRVEISWRHQKNEVEEDIQDLYALLETKPETYCINPNRDTLLILPQGTVIKIPANAFATSSNSCVTFNVKEVYKLSDMIRENLNTMSNERLLESAGMVNFEVLDSKGNKVELNPDKSLMVMLPTDTLREDMELFYGDRNPHHDINWNRTGATENDVLLYEVGNCNKYDELPECEYCPVLFCRLFGRIDETIKGTFNDSIKTENKQFRSCQKKWKKIMKTNMTGVIYSYLATDCEELMELYGVNTMQELEDTLNAIRDLKLVAAYDKYGVDNYKDYQDTLTKIELAEKEALYKKYGVTTWSEYQDTLRKIKVNEAIENIENGNSKSVSNDLNYYVLNVSKLGWINCDAFSDVANHKKVTFNTDLKQKRSNDCKLIFKRKNAIMTTSTYDGNYKFKSVPKKEKVTVLALKYQNNQAYVYLNNTIISAATETITFREVEIEELKEILKSLD